MGSKTRILGYQAGKNADVFGRFDTITRKWRRDEQSETERQTDEHRPTADG